MDAADPDVVMVAWPCTVWSPMQRINRKTCAQRQRLLVLRRLERRTLLCAVARVSDWCKVHGKISLGENPKDSEAWQEQAILRAFPQATRGQVDMCMHNKRRPDNNMLVRKRTLVSGPPEVHAEVCLASDGKHQHSHVEGSMKYCGKTMKVPTWSGGYSKQFCTDIIRRATNALQRIFTRQA
jgi:hypothetical protein